MGNNVNFVKVEVGSFCYWQWTPWLLCFMFTKILPRMHLGLEMGTYKILYFEN